MSCDNKLRTAIDAIEAMGETHVNDAMQVAKSLRIAVAQIELSLKESSDSVDKLVGSMTSAANSFLIMEKQLVGVQTQGDAVLHTECAHISSQIQKIIMAFQFYDRLTQRFSHVKENLDEVISVIGAPDREYTILWENLKKRMRTVYSLEQEQELMQSMSGENAEENTADAPQQFAVNNVELF